MKKILITVCIALFSFTGCAGSTNVTGQQGHITSRVSTKIVKLKKEVLEFNEFWAAEKVNLLSFLKIRVHPSLRISGEKVHFVDGFNFAIVVTKLSGDKGKVVFYVLALKRSGHWEVVSLVAGKATKYVSVGE